MASLYLRNLSESDRTNMKIRLYDSQGGRCFICEAPIDKNLHWDHLDIDHIVPSAAGGKDSQENFALTHESCNRSKQASNLEIARLLARFGTIASSVSTGPNRPHLGDILAHLNGAQFPLSFSVNGETLEYSFPKTGSNHVEAAPLIVDGLGKTTSAFINLPIEYLFHDERINPRAISAKSLRSLAEEFKSGYPQLHAALAWTTTEQGLDHQKVMVFDGQHKLAAQLMLGVRKVPVRVFFDPEMENLLTANTHAGTTLRQVAFDKSVQRHLGSQLLTDRIREYQKSTGRAEEDYGFSEQDLMNFFKGQKNEIRRYILDDVRNRVTNNETNTLRPYIEFGGKGTDRPLSYATVEKTFYSFFIGSKPLSTRMDHKEEQGENPRTLEVEQLTRLMNIIQKEIVDSQYDTSIGTSRLEKHVQEGKKVIPGGHLRAARMLKEEVLYGWLDYVRKAVRLYFDFAGSPDPHYDESAPMQSAFPDPLWDQISNLVRNISLLPLWQDRQLAGSAFGGKQVNEFWRVTFMTGKSPNGHQLLNQGINIQEMIKN